MSERAEAGAAFWEDADDAEARRRYRALVDAVDDGVCRLDADGRFVAVNAGVVETTGYDREELVGAHVSTLLDADDAAAVERRLAESGERTDPLAVTARTADGDRVSCELRLNLLGDDGVPGSVGILRSVAEREDDGRRRRERRLSALLSAVPGMVYRCRNERGWPMEFVSEGCRALTGYDPATLERGDVSYGRDVVVEADREELWTVLQQDVADGTSFSTTYRIRTADGDVRWVREHGRGVFEDGDLVAFEGIVVDVTERNRLEDELEAVFGRVTDAFYALDDDWQFTHANESAEQLIDYRGDGLVGENFWEVFEWATDSKLGEEYRTAMETQEPTSFEFYYPEPLSAWYEVRAFPSETGLSVYFRDVTERKERERELEEYRSRYRTLVENFPNGAVALVDEDLRYLSFGGTPEGDADVTREDLEGSRLRDALPAELAEVVVPHYEAALDGETARFQDTVGDRTYQFHFVPVRDDDGDVFAALGMSQDITERKEAQRKLAESERRYRTLVENFPNGAVGLFDDDLRYTVVGGDALDDVDTSAEEIVGKTVWERYPDEIADRFAAAFRTALDGEKSVFEISFHDREWLVHTVPVTDDDGEAFAGMVMVQDVTERVEYERKLAESERRYRTLAEHFPNGIVTLFDYDLRYTLAAGRGFEDIPVDPADVEDEHFRDVWDEDTADSLEPLFEAALDGEERSVELEYAGREWVVHAVPITDERGDVFAGMTMAQDVTEQKERERYLRDAKTQLEAATEAGAVGTWEWHVHEDEFVAGTSFARTFGVDPEAAREGVPLDRIVSSIHEDDRQRVEQAIEEAMQSCGEYEEEYRVWNADDELRWVVARGHVECDDEGDPVRFPGALTDITDRKRAELRLQRSKNELESLFEILPVGVLVAAPDGRIVNANDTAKRIWGGNVFDAGSVAEYDRFSAVWADSGDPVAPEEWTLSRVLRGEEVTDPDVFEIEAADGVRRTVAAEGAPVRNADGEVTRGVVTFSDVTDRREYQRRLEETVEKLEESNERLEQFASMLAHELRNPVTIGQIYSQQLSDGADSDAVGYVTEAFDRIEDMIEVMLVLTRGREAVGESTPVSLADAARDAWGGLEAPDATLGVELDGVTQADETYVRHLFRNLFENAVQHGGADVTIEVGRLPATEDGADGFYVADDGTGIPPDDRDEVFETGFTTAANEGGTGLGLAFVAELAEVYDWSCTVTESEDGGARFEFRNVDLVSGE